MDMVPANEAWRIPQMHKLCQRSVYAPTASVINIAPVVSGKHGGTLQLTGADSQHLYEKTLDAGSAYHFNNYEYRCIANRWLASIHRAAESSCSRKLGFRRTAFPETGLPVYGVLGNSHSPGPNGLGPPWRTPSPAPPLRVILVGGHPQLGTPTAADRGRAEDGTIPRASPPSISYER
jgi:hypothetical protein